MIHVPDPRSGVKSFALPRRPRRLAIAAAAMLVALPGCDSGEVSGQVVAVVNGEEITIPELNSEARARGLVIGNDRALRNRVVQDLIERKLLVRAALKRQLDRTPEHLLAKRRSDEMLLASALLEAVGRQRASPSDQELARFIESNPHAFDRRALLSVDRIRALAAFAPGLARSVAAARSLDEAQALLTANKVVAERRVELWDSATFPAEMAGQLLGADKKETVLLQLPDQTVVANVIEVIPQPTPAANRAQLARDLLSSQRSREQLQSLLQREKSLAKIRYHPQFAPR